MLSELGFRAARQDAEVKDFLKKDTGGGRDEDRARALLTGRHRLRCAGMCGLQRRARGAGPWAAAPRPTEQPLPAAALFAARHQRAAAPGASVGGPAPPGEGVWQLGKLRPREARLGPHPTLRERQTLRYRRDPWLLYLRPRFFSLNVVFLSSWRHNKCRYFDFLTSGVFSSLDCKSLEAGTWASLASSLRPPGSFLSAY